MQHGVARSTDIDVAGDVAGGSCDCLLLMQHILWCCVAVHIEVAVVSHAACMYLCESLTQHKNAFACLGVGCKSVSVSMSAGRWQH